QSVHQRSKFLRRRLPGHIRFGTTAIHYRSWHQFRTLAAWQAEKSGSDFDLSIHISRSFLFRSLHWHAASTQTRHHSIHFHVQSPEHFSLLFLLLFLTPPFLASLAHIVACLLVFLLRKRGSDGLEKHAHLPRRQRHGQQICH